MQKSFEGIINILKPPGLTSGDVVVKVRGILRRITGIKHKAGHLGTLDPGASGVLPIAVGKATRLFELLTARDKKYRAIITFGTSTDTLDSYGKTDSTSGIIPSIEELQEVLPRFTGETEQIPPRYSAVKINGRKAYELARKDEEFTIKPRKVIINSIELIRQVDDKSYMIDINCKGGTYIRSLVGDIAKSLDTVAYMSLLIRLSAAGLNISDSKTLDEFAANPCVTDIGEALSDMIRYDIDPKYIRELINGVRVTLNDMPKDKFVVYIEDKPFGIARSDDNKLIVDTRLW
ncbi:MAG: tRNA pseudouridine(55) synthase TruB [Christensenellales bacterium]|jgi:tRNA pseudouridine55 synthase